MNYKKVHSKYSVNKRSTVKQYFMLNVHIICLLLCIPVLSHAQKNTTSIPQDINYGSKLAVHTLAQPLAKPLKSALIVGLVSAGTALAISQDEAFYQATQSGRNSTKNFMAHRIGEPFGSPYYQAAALGGLYLTAKLFKQVELSRQSTVLLSSAALTGTTVIVLKSMFSRERPYVQGDAHSFFNGAFAGDDFLAFPSAHTALAFSFASTLTYLNPDEVWIPLIAYPLAGLTAWSRMYDAKHWLSDVLLGAALGHLIGKTMVQQHTKIQLSLGPGIGSNINVGLQLNF